MKALLVVVARVALCSGGCALPIDVCTNELGFSVEPSAGIIRVGHTMTLRADAWTCGGTKDVAVDVVWTSSDSSIIRVSLDGTVTGLQVGRAHAEGIDRSRYSVGPFQVPVDVVP